jgi:hypothetical protein
MLLRAYMADSFAGISAQEKLAEAERQRQVAVCRQKQESGRAKPGNLAMTSALRSLVTHLGHTAS